jgi:hypothetical protein
VAPPMMQDSASAAWIVSAVPVFPMPPLQAYFLPSIPLLLLQSAAQHHLERSLGVPGAAAARLGLGLGMLALLSCAFPLFLTSRVGLLTATAAVGVCYGMAFGTSYELVTRFPGAMNVALTTGDVFHTSMNVGSASGGPGELIQASGCACGCGVTRAPTANCMGMPYSCCHQKEEVAKSCCHGGMPLGFSLLIRVFWACCPFRIPCSQGVTAALLP